MNIIVLISGSGTNLQALIDQFNSPLSAIKILAVISNQPNAFGLQRAKDAGIPTHVINPQTYANRSEFSQVLHKTIVELNPDLIVLAGYMLILDTDLVNEFLGRMINIHPSLLPKFRGLNTHARAIQEKEKFHGASVHYVIPKLDAGPVIMQEKIPILHTDTAQTLAHRVLEQEHKLFPAVIRLIEKNQVELRNNQVYFEGNPLQKPLALSSLQ